MKQILEMIGVHLDYFLKGSSYCAIMFINGLDGVYGFYAVCKFVEIFGIFITFLEF